LFPKLIITILLVVFIAIGLSSTQLFPQLELSPLSTRSNAFSYSNVEEFGMYEFSDLISLLSPFYYGNIANASLKKKTILWENCSYVGILPIILSIFAGIFLFKKNNYVKFFVVLLIFSILFILQKELPLFKILWHILPGLSHFRFNQRFIIFIELSLAVLSAFGYNYIYERISVNKTISKLKLFLGPIVLLLMVINILWYSELQNPKVDVSLYTDEPDTVKYFKKDNSLFRVTSINMNNSGISTWRYLYWKVGGYKKDLMPYIRLNNILQEDLNINYKLQSWNGYSSIYLMRFYDIETPLNKMISFSNNTWDAVVPETVTRIFGLSNVKYIVSAWNLHSNYLVPVMRTFLHPGMPEVTVYFNKQVMPRAFIVPQSIAKDKSEILSMLFSNDFKPMEKVILEEPVLHGSASCEGSIVNIDKYSAQKIIISADLTNDGFLVLTDTFYPGWRVFIDGKEGRILQADYLYRSVPLDKGKHNVIFIYYPASFYKGVLISLLTLVFSIVLLLNNIRNRR